MTILANISGLPLSLSSETADVHYSPEEVDCNVCKHVSLREISPALLNKSLMYPELVYKHYSQITMRNHAPKWPGDYVYDLIYLPDGLLGIEYIKTHIFFNKDCKKCACIIQVINGKLKVILQKNRPKESVFDIDTYVEEAIIVVVETGEKVAIPSGYYYTFVNTGSKPVVFARIVTEEHIVDYSYLQRENGLAYYLIAKNARQEMVVNPRYREVAEVKKISADSMNEEIGYSPNPRTPLYEDARKGLRILHQLLLG